MSTTKIERPLDRMRIIGPGVDALERRKEHNNNQPVTAEKLRTSIARVKNRLFEGLKLLQSGVRERVEK
jgi:hypothetical protein